MSEQQQGKSKISKFKDLLYSRENKIFNYKRRKLRKKAEDKNLKRDWENKDNVFNQSRENIFYAVNSVKKSSALIILLVLSTIFFIGAISYAFFYLTLNQKESGQKIDVSIIGPNTVNSGSDFKFVVKLVNNTVIDFENISVNIKYPNSTINTISGGIIQNETREIKEKLLQGGSFNEKFNIILSGTVGDQRDIEISVIYNAVGYSHIIDDVKVYQLGIDSSPLSLEIQYPQKVLSKRKFDIDISVLSNTNVDLKELLLVVNLPQGFLVDEFSLEPSFRNRFLVMFKIEDLSPGGETNIKITGNISGQHEEEKIFSFEIGDINPLKNEIRTLFAKVEKEIIIKRPDLQLEVTVNGEYGEEHVIQAGDQIKIKLVLRNNLNSIINNLKIEAQIVGNNFDPQKLKIKNGYYDSNNDNIIWNENTWQELKALGGGGRVEDEFSLTVKNLEDLAGYQTNPELRLSFKVLGTNFDSPNSQGDVISEFSTLIKTATHLVIESGTLFSIGPFKNSGELPPQVGVKTTYTAIWRLSNSTNLLEDVEVRAKLPYYVKFIDNISPQTYYVSFDEKTREVIWRIKKIEPYIGHRTPPKTVYFQLEVTPSANQVGSVLDLVGPKTVIALDTFIETQISSRQIKSDTSKIENDPLAAHDIGTVIAE